MKTNIGTEAVRLHLFQSFELIGDIKLANLLPENTTKYIPSER